MFLHMALFAIVCNSVGSVCVCVGFSQDTNACLHVFLRCLFFVIDI